MELNWNFHMLVISSPILMIEACSTVFKMSLSWGVEIIKLSSVESFTWSFTYLLQILAAWCPHREVLKECNFLYIKVEVLIFLANLFSKNDTYLLSTLASKCPQTGVLKESNSHVLRLSPSNEIDLFTLSTCVLMSLYWGVQIMQLS